MTALPDLGSPNPGGEALAAELRWVHDMLRKDLGTIRQMAADAEGGMPGGRIAAGVRKLALSSPLWQLTVNCMHYCRVVHTHHTLESVALFPELRRSNPALGPVVDKLEADHVRVSGLLDDVEAAAQELASDEDTPARARLVESLRTLSDQLLAHLAYEEEQISPTLRTWTGWPGW
ncbi:MAG TPA: hemerythrin domain-containing protein [Streptosporangiaceae bacterium]|jgi:hypothetical protein|nr:hemerythrin domain-containing protein [Streptosporangiaceae bacterium]